MRADPGGLQITRVVLSVQLVDIPVRLLPCGEVHGKGLLGWEAY